MMEEEAENKILEVKEVPLNQLKFREINPNLMSDALFEKLKASIKEFGFLVPIVVDRTYTIIDGHHRARALAELGKDTAVVVVVDIDINKGNLAALSLNTIKGSMDSNLLKKYMQMLRKHFTDADIFALSNLEQDFMDVAKAVKKATVEVETVIEAGKSDIPVKTTVMFDPKVYDNFASLLNAIREELGEEGIYVFGENVRKLRRIAIEKRKMYPADSIALLFNYIVSDYYERIIKKGGAEK